MTVGGEIDVASSIWAYSKVCATELMVPTVRSVKLFKIKAVEYGVVVVAITRKVSSTVVEASHVSTAPSGSPGKVAAMRSADRREKEVGLVVVVEVVVCTRQGAITPFSAYCE